MKKAKRTRHKDGPTKDGPSKIYHDPLDPLFRPIELKRRKSEAIIKLKIPEEFAEISYMQGDEKLAKFVIQAIPVLVDKINELVDELNKRRQHGKEKK